MSIAHTLQRPIGTQDVAKTRDRDAKKMQAATQANEWSRRNESTALTLVQIREAIATAGQRDCSVENEARTALRTSWYRPVRRVSCEVSQQVLVLRGRVPSFYMKQIAQTLVRHLLVDGLVIDNRVEVVRG